jgi:hypothetical protein
VILRRLTELPEAPWGDLGGKPLTDRTLASRLRQYGIKSKVIRVGDQTPRGYAKEDLHDVWLRYVPGSRPLPEAQQAQQAQHTSEDGGLSQKSVADVVDRKRNNGSSERNMTSDVADSVRNTRSERNRNTSMESSAVADVADVADVPGSGADDGLDIPPFLRREVPADRRLTGPRGLRHYHSASNV